VVQYDEVEYVIKDPQGKSIMPQKSLRGLPSPIKFWEAFQVPKNGRVSKRDYWTGLDLGLDTPPGVTSDLVITAYAVFCSMTEQKLKELGFTKGNEKTLAADKQYSTINKPALGKGTTNIMTRSMTIKWDNSPNSKDKKTKMTLKAQDYGYPNNVFVSKR
jgi:hypothetical protein